jgi:4'-phosphopantetheinyl transferase EntD
MRDVVRALEAVSPQGAVFAGAALDEVTTDPFPSEIALVSGAVDKRRKEFHVGRTLARRALARLAITAGPILRSTDRAPLWPHSVVGSISHCDVFCGVIVAPQGQVRAIGLDIELDRMLEPSVIRLVCGGGELEAASAATPLTPAQVAIRLFSIKESVYKAYAPATSSFLDFQDVTVSLHWPDQTFEAFLLNPARPALFGRRVLRGHFGSAEGVVYALCAAL